MKDSESKFDFHVRVCDFRSSDIKVHNHHDTVGSVADAGLFSVPLSALPLKSDQLKYPTPLFK